jgi:hypothetical protein
MAARFQFSIRLLLLTVAAVAVVLALMFQVPFDTASRTLVALVPVVSAFAITGLAFGSSGMRSFCIGASVPLAMMLIFVTTNLHEFRYWLHGLDLDEPILAFPATLSPDCQNLLGGGLLASVALGYLCVGFRLLIERKEPSKPS